MEFVMKQILIKEKSCGDTSYIVLIGYNKGKKPTHQLQGSSADIDTKKKNMKCHYRTYQIRV